MHDVTAVLHGAIGHATLPAVLAQLARQQQPVRKWRCWLQRMPAETAHAPKCY